MTPGKPQTKKAYLQPGETAPEILSIFTTKTPKFSALVFFVKEKMMELNLIFFLKTSNQSSISLISFSLTFFFSRPSFVSLPCRAAQMCAEHGANASCVATLTPGHGWCIEEDRKIGRYRKWYFQHNLQKTVRYIIKHKNIYVHITQITGILHVLHVYCMLIIFHTYLQLTGWRLGEQSCHVLPCLPGAAPWLHVCNICLLSSAPNPMAAPTGAPVGYAKKIR